MGNRALHIGRCTFLPGNFWVFYAVLCCILNCRRGRVTRAPAPIASHMANRPPTSNPLRHRGHHFGGGAHQVADKAGQLRRAGAASLAGVANFVVAHLRHDGA